MGRYSLCAKRDAGLRRSQYVLCQKVLDCIRAHPATVNGRKQDHSICDGRLIQPPCECGIQDFGDRGASLLTTLPKATDISSYPDRDRSPVKPDQLGQAHSCLHGGQQQEVVSATEPGLPVWGGEDCVDLCPREKLDLALRSDLAWYREDTLDLAAIGRLFERQEAEEAPDCRQPKVEGRRTGMALQVQLVEERYHQLRIEVLQLQIGRMPAGSTMGELQEEFECIPIGGDCVWADITLASKTLGKKRSIRLGRGFVIGRLPTWLPVDALLHPGDRDGHSDTSRSHRYDCARDKSIAPASVGRCLRAPDTR